MKKRQRYVCFHIFSWSTTSNSLLCFHFISFHIIKVPRKRKMKRKRICVWMIEGYLKGYWKKTGKSSDTKQNRLQGSSLLCSKGVFWIWDYEVIRGDNHALSIDEILEKSKCFLKKMWKKSEKRFWNGKKCDICRKLFIKKRE